MGYERKAEFQEEEAEAREIETNIMRLAQFDTRETAAVRQGLEAHRIAKLWGTPMVAFRPPPHAHAAEPVLNWLRPDELMIDWGGLPSGTEAQLYIPNLRASDTLELLRRRWADLGVRMLDDRTLSLPVGGMSHIPIPAISPEVLPALLTVQLPQSVRMGQAFTVKVHQVSTIQRRVVGSFELRIPVGGAADFLAQEKRWLAVLRDTIAQRPPDHHWTPVLERLERVVACRVGGFGGDPDEIPPSPEGYDDPGQMPCPDPGAHGHDPDHPDHPRKDPDDDSCDCQACTLLVALEDERLRKALILLLCQRKKG